MARLDLPAPLTPQTTIRRPCGRSRSMFLRLWTETPRSWMAASGRPRRLASWSIILFTTVAILAVGAEFRCRLDGHAVGERIRLPQTGNGTEAVPYRWGVTYNRV